MNNTPGTKTLRKAAMRLLDVMLEAELAWWKGGPERDEQQKRSIDAQMVIADIAAENAAHNLRRMEQQKSTFSVQQVPTR